jgi:hypothetical protein
MLMLVLGLSLLFPSFTRAGDPDDEIRIIDLELRMLSLERAAIDARSREADRERAQRNADLVRDLSSYPERPGVSPGLELDHIPVLDPEPLFPSMRPPWLQPADRLAPMSEEQRARMWCAAPNDCWFP